MDAKITKVSNKYSVEPFAFVAYRGLKNFNNDPFLLRNHLIYFKGITNPQRKINNLDR